MTSLATTQPSTPKVRSHASLHARIRRVLRARILDGRYVPLSRLPSESELQSHFGASRITVRHALAGLQSEGLIFTRQGKGSFVSRPKAFQNVSSLAGFAESMATMGYEVLNELRDLSCVVAPRVVAEKLSLSDGSRVMEIRRVRLLNRIPVSLELTYLPEPLGLKVVRADLEHRDIFSIIEEDCQTPLGHADLKIDATLASETFARALEVPEGAPLMRVERLTHDAKRRPIDFEYLHFRADRFQYHLRIDRHSPKN